MDDEHIRELFDSLGQVSIRRMFGGKGIYHEGLIVAVVLRGELMLKGDDRSGPDYEAAGGKRWFYEGKTGRQVNMPYWTVPDSAFDDQDELSELTAKAYQTALRAKA